MRTWSIAKMLCYRRRLAGLSPRQRFHYVLSVLYGETVRRPGHIGERHLRWIGPRMAELSVTARCQCKCQHCYAAATDVGRADDLSSAEIVGILDQLASLHVPEVCFTGGEALLSNGLPDFVAYARRVGVQPKIITNGILLSPRMVGRLKKAGLAWCTISIDSPDADEHDAHRGYTGCLEKAVAGLAEAIRQGIPGGIQTCARKDTIHSGGLARVVALGHQLGVEIVRFTFPVVMGRYEGAEGQMLSLDERQYVRSFLKDPIVTADQPSEKSLCEAGVTKMAIDASGNVTPCAVVPLAFGNVRKRPLREILMAMAEFQRFPKPKGQCPMSHAAFRDRLSPKGSDLPALSTAGASG